MRYYLAIAYRYYTRDDSIERLIRDQVAELAGLFGASADCRVEIERTRRFRNSGNPFRIRIRFAMPGKKDICVTRDPNGIRTDDPLATSLLNAFTIVRRKLVEMAATGGCTAVHTPGIECGAVVARLFRDRGEGFLRTPDGREIFFTRESVPGDDFDNMAVGTAVWFIEQERMEGPRASLVRIVGPTA